ncbi:S-phase kinase-associated protein 2 [Episyrphus balteatus]|uniref:S-phase kinase-associated protein 2 n=1 Tax=Episyrphus balteatus TaxID=286459 RepID=UPI002485F613|nr:S-phase kinase-associated protein 2 [Episyrphus balteatus]
MSGKKTKSTENNENLCPLSRKRIKPTTPSWTEVKSVDIPHSLEEMGIGMLESDESSSSASAIALAVSASDENSNEATPNLDAPKFCHHHTMQQNRLNYSADLDTTDNAIYSNDSLKLQNFNKTVNNNNNNGYNSTEKYNDPRNSSEKKKKVAILGAGNLSSQKSRSPLATVACNNNYKNISKTQAPTFVGSIQEITPSSSGASCSSKETTNVPSSSSSAASKQFFVPDENFFLYRNRALRGSDGKDHFSKLSDEIILQIFKLLPKKTLIRCSYVCQRFNCCARDESLWTRLDLGGRSLRAGALGDILPRGVVILRLAQSEMSHPIFDPELLQMYPDFECKLQYLDLSMAVITKPSLKSLLSRCRHLKKLSLEHVPVNDEICDEIAKNKDLEALNLAMVSGLEAWSIRKMMIELQDLTSLNCSWTNLNVDGVFALVSNVSPNLMRLNLSGCRKTMFDSHLVTLARRCPQLIELDVSDCTALSSSAVTFICKFMTLEYLSLSRCYQILAPAYMDLNHIPTLKFLDVFGILSDTALEMLEQNFPQIGINKFIHSSVARPTVGTRRTSIWGLRTRD